MVVSLVVVVFITVVFAGSSLLLCIASIRIILCHMRLQLQRLSSNHQLLCKNVVLKTSDAIYHFRVKMAKTIKMAEDQLFIRWCKLFTLRCLPVKNFFRLLNDYGCKYGCKSCCGCFYYSCLRMVVFVIAHCLASMCIIFHHIGLQLQGLSFPHQLLFKNVVLKTSDTIYFFRVKNGWDYQNGWVENCFTWTDWVTDTFTSWAAHHSWKCS